MVPRLEETHRVVGNLVDNPVFLGQPPRPESRKLSSQGFRFGHTFKWVTESGSNDPQEPKCGLAISSNPVPEIINEVNGENRRPFTHPG